MNDLIQDTFQFMVAAHTASGQIRKKTGEPYWTHPARVARLLNRYATIHVNEITIAAAHLHDVVEDTDVTIDDIHNHFGCYDLTRIVRGLTDVYTTEAYPNLNRATRKALECERLRQEADDVKTPKVCDLIDNSESIVKFDSGFANTYMKEKAALVEVLDGACPYLLSVAKDIVHQYDTTRDVRIML